MTSGTPQAAWLRPQIRMGLDDFPRLDRVFKSGSLPGLPATFTWHSYSIAASILRGPEVVHVPGDGFLASVQECPVLPSASVATQQWQPNTPKDPTEDVS